MQRLDVVGVQYGLSEVGLCFSALIRGGDGEHCIFRQLSPIAIEIAPRAMGTFGTIDESYLNSL